MIWVKEPWQMPYKEIMEQEGKWRRENLLRPAVDNILEKTGAGTIDNVNYQQILDFYTKREGIAPLPIEWFGKVGEKVTDGMIVAQFGLYQGGKPFIRLNRAFESKPRTLILGVRHEIEHAIDTLKYGFYTAVGSKHHRQWANFDIQYPHRESIARALKEGKPVPTSVLAEYGLAAKANPTTEIDRLIDQLRCKAEVKELNRIQAHRCPLPAVPDQDYCPLHLGLARRFRERLER